MKIFKEIVLWSIFAALRVQLPYNPHPSKLSVSVVRRAYIFHRASTALVKCRNSMGKEEKSDGKYPSPFHFAVTAQHSAPISNIQRRSRRKQFFSPRQFRRATEAGSGYPDIINDEVHRIHIENPIITNPREHLPR